MTDEAGVEETDRRERETSGWQVIWRYLIGLVECFIELGFCHDEAVVHQYVVLSVSLIFTCSENTQQVCFNH